MILPKLCSFNRFVIFKRALSLAVSIAVRFMGNKQEQNNVEELTFQHVVTLFIYYPILGHISPWIRRYWVSKMAF